jgi:hypothetical protein
MSKSKTLNCPECDCVIRPFKRGRFECVNPKCCVIEVRVHKYKNQVLKEARI